MKKPTADEILRIKEDEHEYHFHDVDRVWILSAMQTYADQCILQRNQEIREWAKDWMYVASLEDLDEFLSTTSKEESNHHEIIKDCHVVFESEPSNELKSAVSIMIDNMEKIIQRMDLVADSEIIQIYGSFIGQLNKILK